MSDDSPTNADVSMVTDADGNVRLVTQDEVTPSPSVVVLTDDQWLWFQGGVRQVCSELLVIVVLLGIACGIAAWRVLSDGWR